MDKILWDKIINVIDTPDVMFDIGVATMFTEAWWARERWQDIKIFGFEPCEARYVALSTYPGILHKIAVTDFIGKFSGYMNNYDFKVVAEEDKDDPYINVDVESTTIDELDRIHGTFNKIFIWADIEGGELNLLKGATKALSEKRIIGLNLELWSHPPVDGWPNCDEIVEYLKEFDYHVKFSAQGDYESWDRESQEDFLFLPGDYNDS